MVERLNGIQEASGSNPLISTTSSKSSNYVWLAFLLLVVVEIRGDSPEQAVLASGCTRLRLRHTLRQSL